jgi:sialate O-acetylesterase
MKNTAKAVCALLLCSLSAHAELRLAHIFQNHMVLQREKPVPVWGWTAPGETVTVRFAGQEKSGQADDKGYWKIILDPLPASSEPRKLTASTGTQQSAIDDVLVGEVWLCAGQSNMARPLRNDSMEYPVFKQYPDDADYPQIRFVNYSTHAAETPLADFDPAVQRDTRWQILSKATALDVMSIPFFFSKELNKKLDVPVGLVQVAVSGTPQTAWMAKETLDAVAEKYSGSQDYKTLFTNAEEKLGKGKEAYKTWAEFTKVEADWKAAPSGRWPGGSVSDHPAVLYNALVHPAAPLALRGVLWHQGEGGPFASHSERMQAQIAQWRKLFGQDFYFIWGTLGRNTGTPPPLNPAALSHRSNIDEEFLLASQEFKPDGKAILVNFFDLGNNATHWGMKQSAGHRMAGAALSNIFKQPAVYTGPEMVEAEIDGATVRIKFKNTGGGLVYEPSINGISGFILDEEGKEPRWANVGVEGDTVTLSHPDIRKPYNAYYGWHSNPHETLFNREGYPAYRFRAVPRKLWGAKAPADEMPLVAITKPSGKAALNVSHVRRHGYLFNVTETRGSGTAAVRVLIPREWKEAVITANGKSFPAGPEQTTASGLRFYEFSVDINGPDIAVSDAENPPDFSTVKRF